MIPDKLDAGKHALQPCPFCGAPAKLLFDESRFDGRWMECCYIACSRGCLDEDQHFNAPGDPQTPLVPTIAEAVRVWNRRPATDA